MHHSREPKFGVSRPKIRVLRSKINHFMRHLRLPNFSVSRLKIHVLGNKLDTLCATRADPNLTFRA